MGGWEGYSGLAGSEREGEPAAARGTSGRKEVGRDGVGGAGAVASPLYRQRCRCACSRRCSIGTPAVVTLARMWTPRFVRTQHRPNNKNRRFGDTLPVSP